MKNGEDRHMVALSGTDSLACVSLQVLPDSGVQRRSEVHLPFSRLCLLVASPVQYRCHTCNIFGWKLEQRIGSGHNSGTCGADEVDDG